MDAFTQILNKLLCENGLTAYKLAQETGISKQAISYWLNKGGEPSITNLKILAQFFDVTADYLIGMEDPFGNKIAFDGDGDAE